MQRLRLKFAARPFDDVVEEIIIDATYEEFFAAKPDETRPSLAIIAVGQMLLPMSRRQAAPPAIKVENDTLSEEVRFLNDSALILAQCCSKTRRLILW